MAGVVVGFNTVPANPLADTTETDVTVPPNPEALRVEPVKVSPLPRVISCTGVVVLELPNSLLVVLTACILPQVTALGDIVVPSNPATVVTSPVNAGNLPAANVPVAFDPDKSIGLAVSDGTGLKQY